MCAPWTGQRKAVLGNAADANRRAGAVEVCALVRLYNVQIRNAASPCAPHRVHGDACVNPASISAAGRPEKHEGLWAFPNMHQHDACHRGPHTSTLRPERSEQRCCHLSRCDRSLRYMRLAEVATATISAGGESTCDAVVSTLHRSSA